MPPMQHAVDDSNRGLETSFGTQPALLRSATSSARAESILAAIARPLISVGFTEPLWCRKKWEELKRSAQPAPRRGLSIAEQYKV